jgi:ABC-type bacteriocin/lantibiotic exporter with double-glycine peptidase domain
MIANCPLPAIAHMLSGDAGHFVVLHRWSPDDVVIADPALGVRTLLRRAFSQRATGYILLIDRVPSS